MDARCHGLQQMLARYTPSDEEERSHLARMQALCARAEDPFSRTHFAPGHFTASCFILSPDREALLLIYHQKLSRWLQPGGHVEPEDGDVVAAARREAREEVGLAELTLLGEGPFDLDVHPIPARKQDPTHEHFDVRFLFRAPTERFVAASDAQAGRWVTLSEMGQIGTDRSVMRAVEKLRR